MKHTISKIFLLACLLLPFHIVRADSCQPAPQSEQNFVYLSQDLRRTLIALKKLLPEHAWSPNFVDLCRHIEDQGAAASHVKTAEVVDECLNILCKLNCEELKPLKDRLCDYKRAMHNGDAVIKRGEVSDARSGKCKTFCKIATNSLCVSGTATINNLNATTINGVNETITGNLTVNTINGVPFVNGITQYAYITDTNDDAVDQFPALPGTSFIRFNNVEAATTSGITNAGGLITLANAGTYKITWELSIGAETGGVTASAWQIRTGAVPATSVAATHAEYGYATLNTFIGQAIITVAAGTVIGIYNVTTPAQQVTLSNAIGNTGATNNSASITIEKIA